MHKLLIREDADWMATRLTSRKHYPPKPSVTASYYVLPFHPSIIKTPGVEGFGIKIGKYKGEPSLLVSIALQHPFTDVARQFAKRKLAAWNDVVNIWDIPILSQSKKNAIAEVWDVIETAFFELQWSHEVLEIHWNYSISTQNFERLQRRIQQLNEFWDTGSIDWREITPDLVYPRIDPEELKYKAFQAFQKLCPHSEWTPQSNSAMQTLCVNYLRHRESAYHVLLRSQQDYLKTFCQINQAIAIAYPWLEKEAKRQIEVKQSCPKK